MALPKTSVETKPAGKSLTIISFLVIAITWLKDHFGIDLSGAEIEEASTLLVGVVGLIAGVYGRWRADTPLSVKGGKKSQLLIFPLLVGVTVAGIGCAGQTPRAKWYEQQKLLNVVEVNLTQSAKLGAISDQELIDAHAGVKAARRYLDRARAKLPDGGSEFEHLMDLAESTLEAYIERYLDKQKEPSNEPTDSTGDLTTDERHRWVDSRRSRDRPQQRTSHRRAAGATGSQNAGNPRRTGPDRRRSPAAFAIR